MNSRFWRMAPIAAGLASAGVGAASAAGLPEDIWSGEYGGVPSLTVDADGHVSMQIPAGAIIKAGGGTVSGIAKDFLERWASDFCFELFDFQSPHKNLKVQIAVLRPEFSLVVNEALRTLYTHSGYIDVVIDYEPKRETKCAPGS
jgi:hypothetical protein